MKSLIGISCCQKAFGRFAMLNHAVSDTYVRAVGELVGGVPVLIPANGSRADIECLIERLDGIILTGSPSNVEPALYGGEPHPPETPEDKFRDAVTLPLVRSAIALGLPLLGICRGFQEMNVALGGSLHQRLQDLPDRMDHSTPMQKLAVIRHAKAHAIRVVPGSWLHRVAQARDIAVNSLHNQGVDRLAPGLVAEGYAPDGTIEAFRVAQAPGFAVGVQWHPEYDMDSEPVSRRIFLSFADAVASYRTGGQRLSTAAD
ncbi:gamma-glutamyl-gamma-aminobutyrate hydrolase family protein [Acidisoma cellulosilytica]|uniref:gamma-glutamyl-gamma-aminobutyrate hydrolase n=1 Tax=Acidisoma cellulosilyticum TaxID=2802395 RepID=A0A963Z046_9PROT|nr:gamma-glutamyl-gamma-aminobutyrate hydrolase family protein [Acidisoma cellulosilyticum]MCB8880255.1 gamma-glutamyl-gamma-aminobutyrate hydrolase family protein [Acidisoma cellulosilyticum]